MVSATSSSLHQVALFDDFEFEGAQIGGYEFALAVGGHVSFVVAEHDVFLVEADTVIAGGGDGFWLECAKAAPCFGVVIAHGNVECATPVELEIAHGNFVAVVVEHDEAIRAGNALDALWATRHGELFECFEGGECDTAVFGEALVHVSAVGSTPHHDSAVGEFDDAGFLTDELFFLEQVGHLGMVFVDEFWFGDIFGFDALEVTCLPCGAAVVGVGAAAQAGIKNFGDVFTMQADGDEDSA